MHDDDPAPPAPNADADVDFDVVAAPEVRAPRRPGPASNRDVIVQHHVRLGVVLVGAAVLTIGITTTLAAAGRSTGRMGPFAVISLLLGVAALIYAAQVGWRKRP